MHFRAYLQFFPVWNGIIQKHLHTNCTEQYNNYLSQVVPPGAPNSRLSNQVLNCILRNLEEFRKAEMAASSVVLGAMPFMLHALESPTVETALISRRRPVLALLLAVGSPAVPTMKGTGFSAQVSEYVARSGDPLAIPGVDWRRMPSIVGPLLSLGQYMLVSVAVANVLHLAYRLGANAVVVFAPDVIFLPPLWSCLAVLVHLAGVLALRLRVRSQSSDETGRSGARGFAPWSPWEIIPLVWQPAERLVWREDTILLLAVTWLLGTVIPMHLIFGTLIFSGLLFFSVIDAVMITARHCGSAIVCRAVVRMELGGIGEIIS